jgi:hypothetical protein
MCKTDHYLPSLFFTLLRFNVHEFDIIKERIVQTVVITFYEYQEIAKQQLHAL